MNSKSKFLCTCLFLLIILSPLASARLSYDHNSLYIYGALDAAYSRLDSDINGEASSKDGYLYGGRILGNYIYDQFSVNSGVGYFNQEYESKFVNNRKVKLSTKTVFLELNPMFRFTHRHSAGILWNQIVGESLLVGPSNINNSDNPAVTTQKILGLNYYYSIPWKPWRMRLGVQAMKPLDIGERSGFIGMFSFQLGFPLVKNLRQSLTRKRRVEKAVVNVTLKKQFMNFSTNSAELDQNSKTFLQKLGSFLENNPDIWTNLSIEGHTDSVGAAEYNLELSVERARSVVFELVAAGAPQEKIFFEGYGEEKLLEKSNTANAHQKNRRVEMHFVGPTDAAKIQNFFNKYSNN